MQWDIVIAVLAAVTQAITGFLGWRVAVDGKVEPKRQEPYEWLFLCATAVGIVMVGTIAYRNVVDKVAAGVQQKHLEDSLNSAQVKLDKTQELLNASLLSQERLKGQLDALALIAGKFSSGGNMKEVVDAIRKVADNGRVATLTNQQLCDRENDLAKRLRAFAQKRENIDSRASLENQQAIVSAKTDEERNRIFREQMQNDISRYSNTNLEFQSGYVAEAIYLRDEIGKRLPSLPQPAVMEGNIFKGIYTGPSMCKWRCCLHG